MGHRVTVPLLALRFTRSRTSHRVGSKRGLARIPDHRYRRLVRAHASGHAAAPPSAASNSRRLMVTVMRPSRARCVEGRIPREKLAVVTARHLARARRAPSRTVNVLAVFTPNDGSSPVELPFVPPLAAFEYGGV